jgi:hypothetical protein
LLPAFVMPGGKFPIICFLAFYFRFTEFSEVRMQILHSPGHMGIYTPFCGPTHLGPGVHLAEIQPTTEERMMDDAMYPVDAVRLVARTLRSAELSWYDADYRLVEKVAEEMTMQEFIDAAEDQRDITLRENARKIAAFMNHDGAGKQTTLGEILDRDDRLWRG